MKRASAAIAVCLLGGACAGVGGGSATLRYEAEYAHRISGDAPLAGIGEIGLSVRGSAGEADVGYLVGADLHFGATYPLGFAYDADLYLGGMRLTVAPLLVGVGAGIGVSGAVDTRDDAFQVPLETAVELSLGEHFRLMLRGRAVWSFGAANRERGASEAPFADEAHVDLALRIGPNGESYGFRHGYGYFAGVTLHEAEGSRYLGLVFGHALDADFERDR